MSGRRSKLYNYIVNTFKISEKSIDDVVKTRVEHVLSKSLEKKLDTKHINSLIVNKIGKTLKEGFDTGCYSKEAIEEVMREILREEVAKILKENYVFEVKSVDKK